MAQRGKAKKLKVRLKADGDGVDLSAFTYEAPEGKMGAALSVTPADVQLQLAADAEIEFALGVKQDADTHFKTYIKQGVIAGKRTTIRREGDTFVIDALNPLADRFELAADHTQVLFNPDFVNFGQLREQSRGDVIADDGEAIAAELIARRDLDMKQALHFCYCERLGFAGVITNLENFPVRRLDFQLGATYHETIRNLIALQQPEIFADDLGFVWVVDKEGLLPPEMVALAQRVDVDKFKTATPQQTAEAPVTACLLTYRTDAGTGSDSEWPEGTTDDVKTDPPQESGFEGQPGFVRTIFEHHWKVFHDPETGAETRRIEWRTVQSTWAFDESDGIMHLISVETQVDKYSNDWRLQTGFEKTIEARVQLPDSSLGKIMLNALTEKNVTTWHDSITNPDVKLKTLSQTDTEGLVIIEGSETGEDTITKVPILDAQRNHNITRDFQTVRRLPIKVTFEQWRDTGAGQIDVHVETIDKLIPQRESSHTLQGVADRAVNLRDLATVTRLITDPDEIEPGKTALQKWGFRKPITLDAGDVPYQIARKIALRRLKRAGQVSESVSYEIPWFDANLRRGSIRKVVDRMGNSVMIIVRSFTITGQSLGIVGKSEISTKVQGIRVRNV